VTLVYAHRGASRVEPQNTLAAFGAAVAMGADGVELDVRRTLDDRLVVHHDPTLADGSAIRAKRQGDLPAHVPTLTEALDACAGLIVNIEIKNDPDEPDFDPDDWVADQVATELAGRDAPGRWLISSFRFETVDRFRELLPVVRTAWLTIALEGSAIRRVADAGHAAIHPYVDTVDEAGVRAAHGLGLAVNVWTCNDADRMAELVAWGVDGICTDVPDVALAVRRGG
jgi:glycerophosphoryl diester phosphodiesterase